MDGAAHLYNSNLIIQLLKNDSNISTYFELNNSIIPNWTCFLILSFSKLFFPAFIAEKILFIIYFSGLAFSFRVLTKELNIHNSSFSILIFPFTYTLLFHLGFYNYSLSFILLFSTLYYWLKTYKSDNYSKYFILFILFLLTYFSALLTFLFLGLIIVLFIISQSLNDYYNKKPTKDIIIKSSKELGLLFLVTLPSLIFSIIFIKSSTFFPTNDKYSIVELFKWLNDVRSLIVYVYEGEEILTEQYLHISLVIVFVSFFYRFQKNNKIYSFINFRKSDIILIPILFSLILLFTIPDGYSAGMMSDRFSLMAYMLFIVWVSSQSIPKKLSILLSIITVFIHLGLQLKHFNGSIRHLNKNAVTISNSSIYIKDFSVVLPINMSDIWVEPHFSNYLGADKPLIILENYEASVGWFPVKWNSKKLPRIKLDGQDNVKGIQWISNINSTKTKEIDYVFLYGKTNNIDDTIWEKLRNILSKSFKLIFVSEDKYVLIYEKLQ